VALIVNNDQVDPVEITEKIKSKGEVKPPGSPQPAAWTEGQRTQIPLQKMLGKKMMKATQNSNDIKTPISCRKPNEKKISVKVQKQRVGRKKAQGPRKGRQNGNGGKQRPRVSVTARLVEEKP